LAGGSTCHLLADPTSRSGDVAMTDTAVWRPHRRGRVGRHLLTAPCLLAALGLAESQRRVQPVCCAVHIAVLENFKREPGEL
jgi:hypothetical protein